MGSATDIDRLVFIAAVYTKYHLDRERHFFQLFYAKVSAKNGAFAFHCISRRDRIRLSIGLNLHVHHCARASDYNFQILICSSSRYTTLRTFIRFLAGPARTHQARHSTRALRNMERLATTKLRQWQRASHSSTGSTSNWKARVKVHLNTSTPNI